MTAMERALAIVEQERIVLVAHREKLRGSSFPAARTQPSTFLHGFLLPFSLIVATLRHRTLGARYLGVVVTRAVAVAMISWIVFAMEESPHFRAATSWTGLLAHRWAWVVWFVSVLSMTEAAVAHLSRYYDEHVAFHVAAIARIRPEVWAPAAPRLSLGLGELWAKAKRVVRGYVFIALCLPLVYPLHFLPRIGELIFSTGIFVWSVYWYAVFSAAKSRHAWFDERIAPPPSPIRAILAQTYGSRVLAPVHRYARLGARVTCRVNAPAQVFARNPPAYLGLALARALLSLPGLYSLSRPIIAVAAGRLCAENDPTDRFSL